MIRKYLVLAIWILLFSAIASFAQSPGLKIYGFFDFETEVSNKDAAGKNWTFDQHHLNMISIYHLDPEFRVFSEIEFEHGPSHKLGEMRGKIYLARAFLEYKYNDALQIRIGKFLPPFGIYNEKHDATPTFLSTILPKPVYGNHLNSVGKKVRLFSKFATGLWGLGTAFLGNWEINYNLYISNGRGPQPDEADNNANKAIGGRFLIGPPIGNLRLGASYYSDRDGTSFNTRQKSLAFDASCEVQNFKLQAELLLHRGEKINREGAPDGQFLKSMGYYAQASYTILDFWTPFIRYDFFDSDMEKKKDRENSIVLGINISITPRIYFKAETHLRRFQSPYAQNYELFIASVAVAL